MTAYKKKKKEKPACSKFQRKLSPNFTKFTDTQNNSNASIEVSPEQHGKDESLRAFQTPIHAYKVPLYTHATQFE